MYVHTYTDIEEWNRERKFSPPMRTAKSFAIFLKNKSHQKIAANSTRKCKIAMKYYIIRVTYPRNRQL